MESGEEKKSGNRVMILKIKKPLDGEDVYPLLVYKPGSAMDSTNGTMCSFPSSDCIISISPVPAA